MLDKLKKRSAKQQAASRANGALGHGPVTARGKQRSCANALKHGLFAGELRIADKEREDFERFRQDLAAEFEPDTVLLWIFFDDIVSLIWRMKTALRLEQAEIGGQLAAASEAQADAAATPVPDLYNRPQRIALLDSLADQIRKGGTIDQSLQEEGMRKLGAEFMEDLLRWRPKPGPQILFQLTEMTVFKSAKYGLNLERQERPELPQEELQQLKARDQEFAEAVLSQNKQEMSLKLIELKRQHILEMARSASGGTHSQSSRYELAVRTQESQRRNLLRMLNEYHRMKHGG